MVGGYVLVDQTHNNGINKITVSPSAAYRLDYMKNSFIVGLQPGIGFYNLNDNLTHPDQFNYETGFFDQSLYTGDTPDKYSKVFADVALGVNWSRPVLCYMPNLGIAFYHINRPKTFIYNDNSKSRLPVKTNIYFDVPIILSKNITLVPSALLTRQRKSQEFIAGADGSFKTNHLSTTIDKVFTGIHYRNAKANGFGSMVMIGGIEFYNIRFAISYDQYFNSVESNSSIGSTVELTVVYKGINSFTDKFSIPCETY
jgi:hypothetical protein